ncbi:MAG: secondary thiamine-phosphate synthase enzyme YjbQ [bacterium]|nr:secondary thiamine-phosphate synthase enzyme YjbQ [bacterium]
MATSAKEVKILHELVPVETKGDTDIIDITTDIQRIVQKTDVEAGMLVASVNGSTASLTTIEFEPGLVKDFKAALERLFPKSMAYAHDAAWGDGNGYAHIRASMIGSSVTVPIHRSKLQLGTWQQIVLIDFDNRPRHRDLFIQIVGQ